MTDHSPYLGLICRLFFVAALFSGSVAAAPKNLATEREYDFRGAVLGMSLAELRTTVFPDADIEPKTQLICSSDQVRYLYFLLDSSEKALGLVKCAYYTSNSYVSDDWEPAMLSLGTHGTATHVEYAFVPDPGDHIPRLFSISVVGYSISASSALDGLKGKFGPPTSIANDTVSNRMGAKFNHTVAVWLNPMSTIVFENPSGDADTLAIIYRELRLSAYVNSEKKRVEGPSSNKM